MILASRMLFLPGNNHSQQSTGIGFITSPVFPPHKRKP